MAKGSIYSNKVLSLISNNFNEEVKKAVKGSAELKKIVNKELKRANQRIRQIEQSDLPSPAVKKVLQEYGLTENHKYTVFSIKGLNPENEIEWERVKLEYSKAMAFLNQPTSLNRGVKEYINSIGARYDLPYDVAKTIVDRATEPEITEIGLLKSPYEASNSFLQIIDSQYEEVKREMFESEEEYYQELEEAVENASAMAVMQQKKIVDEFTSMFKNTSPRLR